MKTKFNVSILKRGEENENLTTMIASHNQGLVPLCLEDFISYAQCRVALVPTLRSGFAIEKTDEDGELRVTEDGGKSYTLLIQEVEIYELIETN